MFENNSIAIFESKKIRRIWFNEEWWFVITDVIRVLTDSVDPSDYFKKLRKRDESLSEILKGGGQFVPPLGFEFETEGGRQIIQCWNLRGIFRLIQSIPSPKAEPFKLWLAKVGYQRIQEIQNPELIQKRMIETYKAKGYSDAWIEKRVRGIAVRDELTEEWSKRGIKEEKEFSILTAEISKATFDMTPKEYKDFKGLKKENLRDHMNDLELIFTMLGESVTKELTVKEDPKEFPKAKTIAKRGGGVAGVARKVTEKELGRKVSTKDNYLTIPEKQKRLMLKSPQKKKKIKYNTKLRK